MIQVRMSESRLIGDRIMLPFDLGWSPNNKATEQGSVIPVIVAVW